MTRNWENFIDGLAIKNGYSYDFLLDRFNEVMEEDGDLDYFITVTEERGWYRSVSIFIMGDNTSVNIYPYETGLQKWIQTYEDTKDSRISRATYRCPNCGAASKYASPYCSICGEQLRV